MLIVSGTYRAKTGKREEFMKTMYEQGIVDAIRKEKGNISYDYYYPVEGGEGDIFFLEKWSDREAWENHKIADHVVKLQDLKKQYGVETIPGFVFEVEQK